jgi:methyl-accepting chemotaxis protein
MRASITTKIVGLVVVSVIATVGIVQGVAYYFVRDGFEKVAAQVVRGDCNVLEREIAIFKERYLDLAWFQALREPVIEGILAGDTDRMRQLGRSLLTENGVDLIVFIDAAAKVVARGHSERAGDNIGSQEGVKRALAGEACCLLESGNTVGFSIRAYAPVKQGDAVIGLVVLGQDLTRNSTLVDGIKRNHGVESTIFAGDTRVSTTIETNGKRAVGTKLDNPAIRDTVLRQGKTFFGENTIFGREYRTAYLPLRNGDDIVGMAFVGIDMSEMLGTRDAIIRYIGLGGLICMVVFAGLSLWLSRRITWPLLRCVDFAHAVSQGATDVRLDVREKDETGTLAKALATMAAHIKTRMDEVAQARQAAENEAAQARVEREKADEACRLAETAKMEGMLHAAGRIEGVVEVVTSASQQLAAQIEQANRGAEDQSRRAGEAAVSMEQLNVTVLEVAKNASRAAATTDQAKAKAEEGASVVGEVVTRIGGIAEQSRVLKEDMADLGRRAEDIGAIMNVISDIADQTNLLALNAAIEAARAGEAGRGFAVVADEVRKLAEKTMHATSEVGAAIRGIQSGTQANVANFDRAVQSVEAATALARRSGEALSAIVGLVDAAADQVRSIATAAEEQSAASEEIGRTVDHINRISGETAQTMGHSAQAVEELAGQSRNLHGLVLDMQREGAAPALGAG